ncbi:transmembrane protein 94-like [Latimeria chalumnae]|uniref:transmembrane protein 94-like n=1 Tax=Latimeria chalumnae TaxID=7897 RepID=UPI00313C08D7
MEHSHTGYQEQHDTADAEDDALRSPENEDHLQSLHNQIFLGLVSCQHQARLDMVRFISGLDHACIRFVYFSLEDELKSKVFAEKMGLETGWNCHISLQSHMFDLSSSSSISSLRDTAMVCNQSQNAEEAQLLIEGEPLERNVHNVFYSESASFIEDLNRAKLPKGIENIRPHLENIDNVPLLVPLFTDCTPETTCEMVKIMQEYGEVVCCLGSALNIQNNAIFLQSDISISLDPLFPSNCWNPTEKSTHTQLHSTTPLNLSSILGSLPCSIHLCNYDNSSIIQLIKQARHTTSGIRKCFLFLLQCQLFLVMIQVLACLVQLPPPLGTTDVLCLSCIYFPLVSVSFLGKPPDSTIMNVATGKNLKFLPKRTQQFFVLYFLVKFGLTVCTYLACFGFMLRGFCMKYHSKMDYLCHPFAPFMNSTAASPNWFGEYSNALMLAQKIIAFFILINGCLYCSNKFLGIVAEKHL